MDHVKTNPKEATLKQALSSIRGAGYSRTKPRELLLTFLISEHGPFSIEDFRTSLRSQDLDVVTIYRCMQTFEKLGLVRRCDFGDGIARFEFEREGGHHHHVICKMCRRSESLGACQVPKLEQKVKRLGYSEARHHLEFSGVCRKCTKKSGSAKSALVKRPTQKIAR